MPSYRSTVSEKTRLTKREAQRRETRERLFEAAVEEYRRAGMADADVGVIIAAADVVRGTFYFHFPTKEHVLLELVKREEERMAAELAETLPRTRNLADGLRAVLALTVGVEQRLGARLFRDVVAAHFSATRPEGDDWMRHPVIVLVVDWIEKAQQEGKVVPTVDATSTAISLLLGIYALLVNERASESLPEGVLDSFLTTMLRGIETR
jgi:TetR/AcrR family transcriptional repressor of uid operon